MTQNIDAAAFNWQPFGDGWTVEREGAEPVEVELPHDAMIGEPRHPDAPSGPHGAFFPGGTYRYRKRAALPLLPPEHRAILLFEGISRSSSVIVNSVELGGSTNAYRAFEVDITDALRTGEANDFEVVADNSEQPNSRWYVGSGIHRAVRLQIRGPITLGRHGVRIRTTSLDPARVEVDLEFSNPERRVVRAEVVLTDSGAQVAESSVSTDGTSARMLLVVTDPRLWSADDPHRYDCSVVLRVDDDVVDAREMRIGLRTIEIDARHGLLVNGHVVLLRGANIHHDNGVIGSVALPAAERRRAEILKAHGFNAIRSAHNPVSSAMLDACDELGLYVIDETTDVWWLPKTLHDDSRTFLAEWRADIDGMVLRDRNHPSVIMYSVSNENPETASRTGIELARAMKQRIDDLDGTLPVTAGVNIAMNGMGRRDATPPVDGNPKGKASTDVFDSTAFNMATQIIGPVMKLAAASKRADVGTRGIFDVLDVAGYNYGSVRFRKDAKAHPARIIVGSEDTPGDIARIWPMVERLPNLIGDFLWAGWDYLGEVGVGHWVHGRRMAPFVKPFPYITSGSGVIDITGVPGAAALLAQAVWGTATAPAIAVRPLDLTGQPVVKAAWRPSDAIASWSWSGKDGQVAEVEVYSNEAEVELFSNGVSQGTKKAGPGHGYVARFQLPYRPGELVAVARSQAGRPTECRLRSASGPLGLVITADRTELSADGNDLAHLTIDVADGDGVVESLADDLVTLTIEGPVRLAGFGSAAPATEESYADHEHRTYYGRALAVLRATRDRGPVRVTATSALHGTTTSELNLA
ncbi:MAG: glycoside hydrolase family 2 TIM barrel-domain containing protein [Chloroflexota bacterium]